MASGFQYKIRLETLVAQKVLNQVAAGLDKRKLLAAIGLRWLKWISDNIDAGGLQKPWAAMSLNTIGVNPQRPSERHPSSRYVARLKQSFVSQVTGTRVEVGTNDPYADFMDEGTRPHKIYPRNAKVLRFRVAAGNAKVTIGAKRKTAQTETIFAQFVNHPGTPPRPLLPTKMVAEQIAGDVLNAYVDKLIKQVDDGAGKKK